jgi:hypothetical protein
MIASSTEVPDDAGMRISTESAPREDGVPKTELRLALVEAPLADDEVVSDAPVFLEPEAAALLDDKVLDAEVSGDRVQFHLKEQGV